MTQDNFTKKISVEFEKISKFDGTDKRLTAWSRDLLSAFKSLLHSLNRLTLKVSLMYATI